MKKENLIIIILLSILFITQEIILLKNNQEQKEEIAKNANPFTELTIRKSTVSLFDGQKDYTININCQDIGENEQLLSYQLTESFTDAKINLKSLIYDSSNNITTSYENISSIEFYLTISHNNTDQIFHIKAICDWQKQIICYNLITNKEEEE